MLRFVAAQLRLNARSARLRIRVLILSLCKTPQRYPCCECDLLLCVCGAARATPPCAAPTKTLEPHTASLSTRDQKMHLSRSGATRSLPYCLHLGNLAVEVEACLVAFGECGSALEGCPPYPTATSLHCGGPCGPRGEHERANSSNPSSGAAGCRRPHGSGRRGPPGKHWARIVRRGRGWTGR